MGLLNIDSQEGRFIGKLCMNLLDSRKIYHEWRSGAGAKVDHQRNRLGSYTQQMFGVSRLWIIKFWIRTGAVQLARLGHGIDVLLPGRRIYPVSQSHHWS